MSCFRLFSSASFCLWVVSASVLGWETAVWAFEYEVRGEIHQAITERDGLQEESTSEFTVYVRDCGWLVQVMERDAKGDAFQREVGSTNGAEIVELVTSMRGPVGNRPPSPATAIITSNTIPVGLLDRSLVGHLWLMFASQCYWETLKSDMLTPVYDWKASAGANPNLKVRAQWKLLGGRGSLPLEVAYLGEWDETNGLYIATGTTNVGQNIVPNGFVFEERYAVAMRGMVLRKRVEVEVSAIRGVCSRKNLLPEPSSKTVNVDFRLVTDPNNPQLPTYRNPTSGKWASVEEARKLAPTITNSPSRRKPPEPNSRRRTVLLVLFGASILPGLFAAYRWGKWRRAACRK